MDEVESYKRLEDALRKAHPKLKKAGKVDPERKAEETIKIIRGATDELDVLGINSLRPAHEGIESMGRILKNDGKVSFTVLDPFSATFAEREAYENTALGRLQTELDAAMTCLADSYKRAKERGRIRIFFHQRWPRLSLVAADPTDEERGKLQLNLYPDKEGSRGLPGKTYQLSLDTGISAEGDAFLTALDLYYALAAEAALKGRTIPCCFENFQEAARKYCIKSKLDWFQKYGIV